MRLYSLSVNLATNQRESCLGSILTNLMPFSTGSIIFILHLGWWNQEHYSMPYDEGNMCGWKRNWLWLYMAPQSWYNLHTKNCRVPHCIRHTGLHSHHGSADRKSFSTSITLMANLLTVHETTFPYPSWAWSNRANSIQVEYTLRLRSPSASCTADVIGCLTSWY